MLRRRGSGISLYDWGSRRAVAPPVPAPLGAPHPGTGAGDTGGMLLCPPGNCSLPGGSGGHAGCGQGWVSSAQCPSLGEVAARWHCGNAEALGSDSDGTKAGPKAAGTGMGSTQGSTEQGGSTPLSPSQGFSSARLHPREPTALCGAPDQPSP